MVQRRVERAAAIATGIDIVITIRIVRIITTRVTNVPLEPVIAQHAIG